MAPYIQPSSVIQRGFIRRPYQGRHISICLDDPIVCRIRLLYIIQGFAVPSPCIFFRCLCYLNQNAMQALNASAAQHFLLRCHSHKATPSWRPFVSYANLIAYRKMIREIWSNESKTWKFIWNSRLMVHLTTLPADSSID